MKKRNKGGIGQQKTHALWRLTQRVNLSAKTCWIKRLIPRLSTAYPGFPSDSAAGSIPNIGFPFY
ncbi:hypothetical protein Mettu_3898 [Methylobacter tundripaludum SV96]|uniref:Uncharacterized protein n=1 Tax=Methylobacter tundripaludum (strain ATCC BAA-1195 / DSM 17260 / SV96) TaxID=697282 RepID=G3J0M7_METTV|nr:hypothetical protein Mettu_3898 [Methylobacter tundripaludum SV96]